MIYHNNYNQPVWKSDFFQFSTHPNGQLDLEFDSSAAKLVNLDVILAQLVSPSVALPAQLVEILYLQVSPQY